MPKHSAGILIYRRGPPGLQVLLVHPGGPLWAKKDLAAWSLPKGEYPADEDPLSAAKRELEEETGFRAEGNFVSLGEVKQRGGKIVAAFAHQAAFEADFDPANLRSNTFSMEWPPRSGRQAEFPEVDRAAWFTIPEAREKILDGQLPFLDRLLALLPRPE
jgi:predicted NUDIX family NTP pyrophosphohydrolase